MMRVLFTKFCLAALASAGFGVLQRAPRQALPWGALIGGLCFCAFRSLEGLTGHPALGALAVGFLAAFFGELCARRLKMPATVFSTMGIITTLPGFRLYRTMLFLIAGNYQKAASFGADAMLISGAAALSLGCTTLLCRTLLRGQNAARRQRPSP